VFFSFKTPLWTVINILFVSMQVAPFPLLSAVPAAPFLPEGYGEDIILAAAARRQELELRLAELNKRKEKYIKASTILQDMDHHNSQKKHLPQPGLVQPGEFVSAEALSASTVPDFSSQEGRPSVTAQKMNGGTAPVHHASSKSDSKHHKDYSRVSVEALAGPATPTRGVVGAQHQNQSIKEVDVEPHRRGRRQISSKSAGTVVPGMEDGEDWFSKLIEYLWPKIRQVIEDMGWEMVPRK
jgi:hypothetical protein